MLYSAQFSNDGKLIAAGGYNHNMARVFDRESGNILVGTLAGLSRGVFSVAFGTRNRLAVAGGDAAVRVFNCAYLGKTAGGDERTITLEDHAVADDATAAKK